MSRAVGTRLGAFDVVALIGAGGMGEVYRAPGAALGRHVAIKVLPSTLQGDAMRIARFEREARVLAFLNHPHIAAIYGLETVGWQRALSWSWHRVPRSTNQSRIEHYRGRGCRSRNTSPMHS